MARHSKFGWVRGGNSFGVGRWLHVGDRYGDRTIGIFDCKSKGPIKAASSWWSLIESPPVYGFVGRKFFTVQFIRQRTASKIKFDRIGERFVSPIHFAHINWNGRDLHPFSLRLFAFQNVRIDRCRFALAIRQRQVEQEMNRRNSQAVEAGINHRVRRPQGAIANNNLTDWFDGVRMLPRMPQIQDRECHINNSDQNETANNPTFALG